jgi:hypothetical protein
MTTLIFDTGHLVERFGLFVIIALGESVVNIGAAAAGLPDLTGLTLIAVAASFVPGRCAVVGLLCLRHERHPPCAGHRADPDRHRAPGAELGSSVLCGRHHRGRGRPG